jgi:hypothetical protein
MASPFYGRGHDCCILCKLHKTMPDSPIQLLLLAPNHDAIILSLIRTHYILFCAMNAPPRVQYAATCVTCITPTQLRRTRLQQLS